uniref:Uncharacterized protein n=1 Tax=Solanum tuberosum TaxID=4113 RepID=M1CWU0_SOLTU
MSSLVLLLAELLRHENTDYLTSPSSSVSNSCAVVADKGVSNKRVFNNSSNNFNTDFNLAKDFEELPKICVDFVWP